MANTIGLSAMLRSMSAVSAPRTDRPKKASAPAIASVSVRASVATAWALFHWFMPEVRPWKTTPLVSHSVTWAGRTPIALISSTQAIAAAPAPFTTSLMSANARPVRWQALISPAAATIAVPCWSSWNTGMSISSRSRSSITKHSGALMSSRLMPPKEGPRKRTQLMNSSTSSVETSRSMPSTSAKRLNRATLPSMTGLLARAPRLPRPSTAVPLLITATMLPLDV